MSDDVRRRAILTAGIALGAMPLVQTLGSAPAHAAKSEDPLIGPATGEDLHVMSFNVRVPVDAPPRSWAERRPLIRELLRRERPTLIGTQEGIYGQLQDMLEDLGPSYEWIHLFRNGGSSGEAMAIFYDNRRLRAVAYNHLWLSDTPLVIGSKTWGNNVVRMLTWVRFRDRSTGKEFVHLNTHFDHQSEPSRQKSADMVLRTVREFDVPTVVTGDFNTAQETSQSYQILVTDGGLLDTWNSAEQRLTPEYGTFNSWRPEPVEGGNRIDWVLTTSDITTKRTGINTSAPDGSTPSDHWPVQSLVHLP